MQLLHAKADVTACRLTLRLPLQPLLQHLKHAGVLRLSIRALALDVCVFCSWVLPGSEVRVESKYN